MIGAFGGEESVKANLLAKLESHATAGTLRFGSTCWDEIGGSPLGISIAGEDSAEYAARFGYPLPLASLLDVMTAWSPPDQAVADTLRWVSCVEPGADLLLVPDRIVDDLLHRMDANRLCVESYRSVRALHRLDLTGCHVPRKQWSGLRGKIEREIGNMRKGSDMAAALGACSVACWPLNKSRSIMIELLEYWRRDLLRQPDPAFGINEKIEAETMLESIVEATRIQRAAGEWVDIPALFRAQAPELATRYEAHIVRDSELFEQRTREMSDLVLDQLAVAGSRTQQHLHHIGNHS